MITEHLWLIITTKAWTMRKTIKSGVEQVVKDLFKGGCGCDWQSKLPKFARYGVDNQGNVTGPRRQIMCVSNH